MSSIKLPPELKGYQNCGHYNSNFNIWKNDKDYVVVQKKYDMSEFEDLKSILNNFQTIKTEKHPNIVNYIAIQKDDSDNSCSIFYPFEYGYGLRGLIGSALEQVIVLRIFHQLLDALKFLHSKGIMHKNIKPENILLSPTGVAKFTDIGALRKFAESDSDEMNSYEVTSLYSSPEYKSTNNYTFHDDVYSLCLVIYELCAPKAQPTNGVYPEIPNLYSSSLNKLLLSVINQQQANRPSLDTILKQLNLIQYPINDEMSEDKIRAHIENLTPEHFFYKKKEAILKRIHKNSKKGVMCATTFLVNYYLFENWDNTSNVTHFITALRRGANYNHAYLIDLLGISSYAIYIPAQNYNEVDVYQASILFQISVQALNLPHSRYLLANSYLMLRTFLYQLRGFSIMKELAEENYVPAINRLGLCYLNGTGVQKNEAMAFKCFVKASKSKYVDSFHNLGICYLNGIGVQKNIPKAIGYFKLAIEKYHTGSISALKSFYQECKDQSLIDDELQNKVMTLGAITTLFPEISNDFLSLGYFYLNGTDTIEKDDKKAAIFFKLVSTYHFGAQIQAAILIYEGKVFLKNIECAYSLLSSFAKYDISDVNYYLGLICYSKFHDFINAIEYFDKASKAGNLNATFQLALCNILFKYQTQDKLTDEIKSLKYLASKNQQDAMYALALFYKNGYSVAPRLEYSIQTLEWLARRNYPLALYDLGLCYLKGEGTISNPSTAVELFGKGMEQGNIGCMCELAKCYLEGKGVPKDQKRAFQLFLDISHKYSDKTMTFIVSDKQLDSFYQKAIDEPYLDAIYHLAFFYKKKDGDVVEQNLYEAFRLFNLAADKGHYQSLYEVGRFYENGEYVELDIRKAANLYETAFLKGNYMPAGNQLAALMMKGDGIQKNAQKAFGLFSYGASRNHVSAIYNLAVCYYKGDGVERNRVTAFHYFKLAAENGMEQAMIDYGFCYLKGIGCEQDYVKAFQIFDEAAKKGNLEAIYLVGYCYLNGYGVPKDAYTASTIFQVAADKGHAKAAYEFALYHENKLSLFRDNNLVFKYFKIAADKEMPEAIFKLGCCYLYGIGCDKDEKMAFELFNQASQKDHVEALSYLAWCYYRGVGVEPNKYLAIEYYKQASEKGYEKADGWLFLISIDPFA